MERRGDGGRRRVIGLARGSGALRLPKTRANASCATGPQQLRDLIGYCLGAPPRGWRFVTTAPPPSRTTATASPPETMTRPSLVPLLLALLPFPLFASDSARSGPAARFAVSDALVLSDFKADLPIPDGPRELRLLLPEAITLGISEKRGIPGGGGVRDVPITVYGAVTLVLPLSGNGFDYAASRAELVYTGAQTIRASAPLQPHPESPLARTGDAIRGKVRFPVQLPARSKGAAPEPYPLDIELDLTVLAETFAYTPDPDPGIPPWRSDKSKPSGQKLSGRWKSFENRESFRRSLAQASTSSE